MESGLVNRINAWRPDLWRQLSLLASPVEKFDYKSIWLLKRFKIGRGTRLLRGYLSKSYGSNCSNLSIQSLFALVILYEFVVHFLIVRHSIESSSLFLVISTALNLCDLYFFVFFKIRRNIWVWFRVLSGDLDLLWPCYCFQGVEIDRAFQSKHTSFRSCRLNCWSFSSQRPIFCSALWSSIWHLDRDIVS